MLHRATVVQSTNKIKEKTGQKSSNKATLLEFFYADASEFSSSSNIAQEEMSPLIPILLLGASPSIAGKKRSLGTIPI